MFLGAKSTLGLSQIGVVPASSYKSLVMEWPSQRWSIQLSEQGWKLSVHRALFPIRCVGLVNPQIFSLPICRNRGRGNPTNVIGDLPAPIKDHGRWST